MSSRPCERSPAPAISICARASPSASAMPALPTRGSRICGSASKSSMSFPRRRGSARCSNGSARAKSMARPLIVGIVNITEDSFSDGGRFLDREAAIAQARRLAAGGADIVELGAAASNVAAKPVAAEEEIRRLAPVIAPLRTDGTAISIDSYNPEVQRFAVERGVDYLNDIHGFPDVAIYPELAAARSRLVVMHAVQSEGRAQRLDLGAEE